MCPAVLSLLSPSLLTPPFRLGKLGSYFSHCPLIRIPGRVFAVDIYHSKTRQVMIATGPSNASFLQAAVDVVLKIFKKDEEGHLLVFLTGEDEIEKACSAIR